MRRPRRAGLLGRLLDAISSYPFQCRACGTDFRRVQSTVRIERRTVERVPVRVPATIIGTRGKFDAVATDVSVKGCALQSAASIPTTGPLALTLHVGDPPIEIVLARICHMKAGVLGIEFRQMTPTMQARLTDYVATLLTRR